MAAAGAARGPRGQQSHKMLAIGLQQLLLLLLPALAAAQPLHACAFSFGEESGPGNMLACCFAFRGSWGRGRAPRPPCMANMASQS